MLSSVSRLFFAPGAFLVADLVTSNLDFFFFFYNFLGPDTSSS